MTRSLLFREFEPFDALMRLQNELERAFEQPMGWFTTSTSGRGAFPPANIFRRDDHYVVRLEVPGLPPEDVSVDTQLDSIRVSGKRSADSALGVPHRVERWSGEFSRTIQLPHDADASRAVAQYKNGVLNIEVPLREEAKPRKIAIQA
jgi:HSP20 family protein